MALTTYANSNIQGPSDVYTKMLEVKNGIVNPNGTKTIVGGVQLTKKQCRESGIEWSFVENAAQILGLRIIKSGKWGFLVTNI